jgi:hypothetical protein
MVRTWLAVLVASGTVMALAPGVGAIAGPVDAGVGIEPVVDCQPSALAPATDAGGASGSFDTAHCDENVDASANVSHDVTGGVQDCGELGRFAVQSTLSVTVVEAPALYLVQCEGETQRASIRSAQLLVSTEPRCPLPLLATGQTAQLLPARSVEQGIPHEFDVVPDEHYPAGSTSRSSTWAFAERTRRGPDRWDRRSIAANARSLVHTRQARRGRLPGEGHPGARLGSTPPSRQVQY